MNPCPRQTTQFNNDWLFQLNDSQPQVNLWHHVTLPHDWSIESEFSQQYDGATGYLPAGIGWYKKHFSNPLSAKFKRCFIHFDGIYNNAAIELNGHALHFQAYGYAPFWLDLSDYLQDENELVIKVDHSRYVDSRWYTGSGIYRDVELILTGDNYCQIWSNILLAELKEQAYIDYIINNNNYLATHYGDIHQSVTFCGKEEKINAIGRLVSQVIDLKTLTVVAENRADFTPHNDTTVKLSIKVQSPNLWSPDTPTLYRVVTKIYIDDIWVDEINDTVGFRTIKFTPDNGFFLNGQPTKIKGVCLHHDGGLVGAAVPDAIWERRLTKLKTCGVNAIRIAHNPASKRLLSICDRMGFLVQDEFFDEWDYPKDKRLNMGEQHQDAISRGYSEHFQTQAQRDLTNTLRSHINHPCIFMWSIGNEIEWTYPRNVQATGFFDAKWDGNYFWSLPPHSPEQISVMLDTLPRQQHDIGHTANTLAKWVKQIDTTRPITANCILPSASYLSGYADALDVIGFSYRQVLYDYGHQYYPHLPIIGNENLPQWHEWKAVLERKHVAGVFLWTGINYMGESHGKWPIRTTDSGLLDCAGFEKPSYALFRSLWNDSPFVQAYTIAANESDLILNKPNYTALEKDKDSWKTKLWVWDKRNSHWNYMENEWVVVEAYSNCEEVELSVSGLSYGKKKLSEQADRTFRWAVPFEHGVLQVTGFNAGSPSCDYTIHTSEKAQKIAILDETDDLNSAYRQLVCQLQDKAGRKVRYHELELTFEPYGCEWVGCDNGGEENLTPHRSFSINTINGQALAIIKRTGVAEARVTVTSKNGICTTYHL
ncbi:glycoside hydrolase family 2 TIM barrel-domain containing protein [Vibrio sp. FNV 38]|nr:glycoside hydrolase family 2 TIM barrel-domain containing protein [Vibrio sp. FNV 38]